MIDPELVADKLALAAGYVDGDDQALVYETIYKVAGSYAMSRAMWEAVAVVSWKDSFGLSLPAVQVLDHAEARIRCSILEREFA